MMMRMFYLFLVLHGRRINTNGSRKCNGAGKKTNGVERSEHHGCSIVLLVPFFISRCCRVVKTGEEPRG